MPAGWRGCAGLHQNDHMEYKLEVVILPVRNVDRSLAFYTERLGFNLDVD